MNVLRRHSKCERINAATRSNQRKRRENTGNAKLERNSTKEGECVVGIGALQTLDWDTSAINLSV